MKSEETIVNIIFDPTGGKMPEDSREAVCNQALGRLPVPVRSGYRFLGWYQGNTEITSSYTPAADEDLRLTARWKKEKENRKTSSLKLQKRALIALCITSVLLIVTWLIVAQIIAVYHLDETYVDENGVTQTYRYTIKRENGVYKLFDADGNLMPNGGDNEEVFIAEQSSKNHYRIDPETGAYQLKAVVDADALETEAVQGTTLLLYPEISSSNVFLTRVTHADGTSYEFYRTPNGVFIKGFEGAMTQYNEELYATLVFACGWTSSNRKLTVENEVAKKEDGSIDYAVYGLESPQATFHIEAVLYQKDENGKIVYQNNQPVIDYEETTDEKGNTVKNYKSDPDQSHTVYVGDETPDGTGFYVRREGSNSIYILNATYIKQTVLKPIEAMVVPKAVHSVSVNVHTMVKSFMLRYVEQYLGNTDIVNTSELIVAFNYEELDRREGTMMVTRPYVNIGGGDFFNGLDGYEINSTTASNVLGALYGMEYLSCVKLGITDEALVEYGLDKNVYTLGYDVQEVSYSNQIIIGQKNENGNYYVASIPYNMIVEVAPGHLSFLEWDKSTWYEESFLRFNLAYVKDMIFDFGSGKQYSFTLDNTLSYGFYIGKTYDENNKVIDVLYAVDPSVGYVYRDGESIKYKMNNGYVYDVILLDFDTVEVLSHKEALENPDKENVLYVQTTYTYTHAVDGKTYKAPVKDVVYRDQNYYYTYTYYDQKTKQQKTVETVVERGYDEPVYRYKKGLENVLMIGSDFLQILAGADKTPLDYNLPETVIKDGVTYTEWVSALDNFRRFYMQMLYLSLEGDVDEKEFFDRHGMSVSEYLNSGVSPDATITIRSEDYAKLLNGYTYFDDQGNEHKLHDENMGKNIVVRFYSYTPWKSLVTVETFDVDENGNPVFKGGVPTGQFFVNRGYLSTLEQSLNSLTTGQIIPE